MVLHDVLSQFLQQQDEASSPFSLFRIAVRNSLVTTERIPFTNHVRFFVVLDYSISIELRALLHVADEWSRLAVLIECESPVSTWERTTREKKGKTDESDPAESGEAFADGAELVDLLARTVALLDLEGCHERSLRRSEERSKVG